AVDNKVDAPKVSKKQTKKGGVVYLVPVPQANQAQIRIGNVMTSIETSQEHELTGFAAQFIGGGFTSRLMQEIRVEKGLTYSIGAYASEQKNYGRKGINTFTKNETVTETLEAIKRVLETNSKKIEDEHFAMAKRYAKGSYLFGLESTSAFLGNLIYFDHIGRAYEEIYKFPARVDSLTMEQVKRKVKELFDPKEQIILVLGSKKLKGPLEKAGYKVEELNYKDYL
ncbi:MAG: insulinase family protein, partial [Bacteriovoracaceae bacterium]